MTDIALREFLEQRICALDKRIDERFIARDQSLALQAKEYERRLTDLNHEQARLLSDRERFMPREIADQRQRDIDEWRESVNNTLATAAGRNTALTAILSAGISAVVIVLSKFFGN